MTPEQIQTRTLKRFRSRYTIADRGHDTPCWAWTHKKNNSGYGVFQLTRKEYVESLAHRAAHLLFVGPIPDGLEIDHLCRQRDCVNPAHFRLVTHQVNMLAGDNPFARNAQRTHCPQGHAYDTENTYRWRGQRHCKICRRERKRKPRLTA